MLRKCLISSWLEGNPILPPRLCCVAGAFEFARRSPSELMIAIKGNVPVAPYLDKNVLPPGFSSCFFAPRSSTSSRTSSKFSLMSDFTSSSAKYRVNRAQYRHHEAWNTIMTFLSDALAFCEAAVMRALAFSGTVFSSATTGKTQKTITRTSRQFFIW